MLVVHSSLSSVFPANERSIITPSSYIYVEEFDSSVRQSDRHVSSSVPWPGECSCQAGPVLRRDCGALGKGLETGAEDVRQHPAWRHIGESPAPGPPVNGARAQAAAVPPGSAGAAAAAAAAGCSGAGDGGWRGQELAAANLLNVHRQGSVAGRARHGAAASGQLWVAFLTSATNGSWSSLGLNVVYLVRTRRLVLCPMALTRHPLITNQHRSKPFFFRQHLA